MQQNNETQQPAAPQGKKQSGFYKFWRVFYPPLVFWGAQFIVTVIGVVIYSVTQTLVSMQGGMPDVDAIMNGMMQYLLDKTLLFVLISGLLTLPLFVVLFYRDKNRIKPNFSAIKPVDYALVIVVAVFANIAITAIMEALDIVRFFPDYMQLEQALSGGSLLIRIAAIGIVAPIVEEYLMRGVVLGRLHGYVPAVAALFIQAAIFGILHMNILQGTYAFAIGILFGYLYLKYGTMLLTVLAHIVFNLSSIAFSALMEGVNADWNPMIVFAGAGIITGLALWAVVKRPGGGRIAWQSILRKE